MLRHLGSLTIGGCLPMLAITAGHLDAAIGIGVSASATLNAKLGLVLPGIQAKLEAALKLAVSLTINPPNIAAQIEALGKMIVALQAQLALGLPTVNLALAGVQKLILDLQADLAALGVDIDFSALLDIEVAFSIDLAVLLGTAGIHAYQFEGKVEDMGEEIAQATGGGLPGGHPQDSCVTWLFAATSGAAQAGCRLAFATAA